MKATEALLARRLTARRAVQEAAPPLSRTDGRERERWTAEQTARLIELWTEGTRDYVQLADAVGATVERTRRKIDNLVAAGRLPPRAGIRTGAVRSCLRMPPEATADKAEPPALPDANTALAELEALLTRAAAIVQALRVLTGEGAVKDDLSFRRPDRCHVWRG